MMSLKKIGIVLLTGFVLFTIAAQFGRMSLVTAITTNAALFFCFGLFLFPKEPKQTLVLVLFNIWPWLIPALSMLSGEGSLLFPLSFPIKCAVSTLSFFLGAQIRLRHGRQRLAFMGIAAVFSLAVTVFVVRFLPYVDFASRLNSTEISVADIQLTGLDTPDLHLADTKGKVVVLDFWNSKCGSCLKAKPEVQALADKYNAGDEVIVASISSAYYEKRERIDSLKYWKPFAMPEYFDGSGELAKRLAPYGCPVVAFVDKQGIARFYHEGYEKDIRGRYTELLDGVVQRLL